MEAVSQPSGNMQVAIVDWVKRAPEDADATFSMNSLSRRGAHAASNRDAGRHLWQARGGNIKES